MEDLIKIATLWQNADSAQVVMGTEPSEDVPLSRLNKNPHLPKKTRRGVRMISMSTPSVCLTIKERGS